MPDTPRSFTVVRLRVAQLTQRVALGVFVGLLALLTAPLWAEYAYFGLDLSRIDLGLACALKAGWSDGSLALSPYVGNGTPLFARPAAQLLYPPRWLVFFFPADTAVSLIAALHIAGGAAGTVLLARTFSLSHRLSVLSGLMFGLCGTTLDLMLHTSYVISATWLPIAWWATRWMVHPRTPWWSPWVLTLALAACLVGGEPQTFGIASALVVAELLRVWYRRRRLPPFVAALGFGCVVAAFLLGLTVWADILWEMSLSRRGSALPLTEALHWSFGPATWLGAIWPGIVDQAVAPLTNYWEIWHGGVDHPLPWNRQPYVGLLFVLVLLLSWRTKAARYPNVIAWGGLLLALGSTVGVLPILMRILPVLAWFRYPAKYLVIATLAAVIAVAMSLRHMERDPTHRRWFVRIGLGAVALHGVVYMLLKGWKPMLDRLAFRTAEKAADIHLPQFGDALQNALVHSCIFVVITGILMLVGGRYRRAGVFVVVIDLLLAAPSAVQVGPHLADLDSPLVTLASQDAVICVQPKMHAARFKTDKTYSPWGQLAYLRGIGVAELNACSKLRNPIVYSPLQSSVSETMEAMLDQGSLIAAQGLGCTHVIGDRAVTGAQRSQNNAALLGFESVFNTGVYVIPHAPEVSVVIHPVRAQQESELFAMLTRDDQRILRMVDLAHNLEHHLPTGMDVEDASLSWGAPNEGVVMVQGTGGGVLAINRAYRPGWEAIQGGHELPTVRVAGHQLGVVMRHASLGPVQLQYAPVFWPSSLVFALIGFGLLGVLRWVQREFIAANAT